MAKNKLSESINTKCGGLKGTQKKRCASDVRDKWNLEAHRKQDPEKAYWSTGDIGRSVISLNVEDETAVIDLKKYGVGGAKAVEHVMDKRAIFEAAKELRKSRKGKWDVKGRKRTLEDVLYDRGLDINQTLKQRRKRYKAENFPHLQSKKK